KTVVEQALSSNALCLRNDSRSLCRGTPTPDRIEAHWIWLIQLGVLRREVDGQGLTERVRLTPMGRTLLDQWSEEIPAATLLDRLQHVLRRSRPRL
ncbi:MAG: Npun_F0494 family protein, partial [Cyanobium sp.]